MDPTRRRRAPDLLSSLALALMMSVVVWLFFREIRLAHVPSNAPPRAVANPTGWPSRWDRRHRGKEGGVHSLVPGPAPGPATGNSVLLEPVFPFEAGRGVPPDAPPPAVRREVVYTIRDGGPGRPRPRPEPRKGEAPGWLDFDGLDRERRELEKLEELLERVHSEIRNQRGTVIGSRHRLEQRVAKLRLKLRKDQAPDPPPSLERLRLELRKGQAPVPGRD